MHRLPMKPLVWCAALLLSVAVQAKLPAPVLSEDAKAKAAETAAKSAWTARMDAYQLCKAQDRVAARTLKASSAKGVAAQPAVATPPCEDPGAFAYVAPKPIEASGAHSPAATAASPPSTNAPAAAVVPKKP
jgi:hypothetical protein